MLQERTWKYEYTSDDGDLSRRFYIPALSDAVLYSRGTGYFSADSLARNMRGLEGLVSNGGKMRLLVGCTLEQEEVDAIQRGESWKKAIDMNLSKTLLEPCDMRTQEGLELLSWMIAHGYLDVRISIRCNSRGEPISSIYHKKIGIVHDTTGDRIAWSGSDNETPSGQVSNSESFDVFTSWDAPDRVRTKEEEFEKDWAGRPGRTLVMDVPEAVRLKLMKYEPPQGTRPVILTRHADSRRNAVWGFIWQAHDIENGNMAGLATAPVKPWPHQVQVLRRLQARKPARLLIADEVGLGKTIQAGLYLRQAWLEGRRQILIMAPASLVNQWQIELREKLNLDWPVYDGSNLTWQVTHARPYKKEKPIDGPAGHGPVIMSSQLARRDERMRSITEAKWDIVVLDEAHHARRKSPNPKKHTPGKLLKLMRGIKYRTEDLILLTATPMQIHQVELYDLLDLLGMPPEWDWNSFETFTNCLNSQDLNNLEFLRRMFKASEDKYGMLEYTKLEAGIKGRKPIYILRGENERLQPGDYDLIKRALRLCSPISRLMSRNTRKQLREYIRVNRLDWRLGTRVVCDKFDDMSSDERKVYCAVFDYTRKVWNSYKGLDRRATGFLSSTYLVRLTSSFAALSATLRNHLEYMKGKADLQLPDQDEWDDTDEDMPDMVKHTIKAMRRDAREVHRLLGMIEKLPIDTKFERLVCEIGCLLERYRQVMVFTQFTDTMDFLREELRKKWSVMCYSGRHGEEVGPDGKWVSLSREETKKRFAKGATDVLLCTQAAAEGLNFQFCGALINYDMPWNPMKVEQRIGRIDRIGQKYDTINITNLYYNGTIEEKRYRVLRTRYNLFIETVGRLPSILSDDEIIEEVLKHDAYDGSLPDLPVDDARPDLDEILAADTSGYEPPNLPITMEDMGRMVASRDLMQKFDIKPSGGMYNIAKDGKRYRITTDRALFEAHADSSEFWSLGSPVFPKPKLTRKPNHKTLKQLLDSLNIP